MKIALKLFSVAAGLALVIEAQAGLPLIKPGPGHQCVGDVFDTSDVDMILFDEDTCELDIPEARSYRRAYFGNSRFNRMNVPESPDKVVSGCFRREFGGEYDRHYSIIEPGKSVRYEDIDSFAEVGIQVEGGMGTVRYSPAKCD